MPVKIDNDALLDAFASEYLGEEPEESGPAKIDLKWSPRLNKVQRQVYECTAPTLLAYGERGTGKSIVGLHKLVNHCVRNRNALAFVCVKEVGQAADGGAWDKLVREILPQWRAGNIDRKTGKRIDKGAGIEFSKVHYDPSTKKPYIWVSNRFGGWSKIILLSLFVDEHVMDKVRGREPSFVFFDEAQTTNSADYHLNLTMQIGRRQGIDDPQQIVYGANPKGPSHWLYKMFFTVPVQDGEAMEVAIDEKTGHPINPMTGKRDESKAIFHVPITENIDNLPAGYWERVQEACRWDKVEEARMVFGLWVDKPDGEALFGDEWNPDIHIRGEAGKNRGVLPIKGQTIILGWDPGAAHHSVHLEQFFPTNKGVHWLWFDEINAVGKYVSFPDFVPKVIDRLMYWEERVGGVFKYEHISDESAFNQYRASTGSFDVEDIERLSKEYVTKKGLPERFIIRLKACPKGAHSVEKRVAITKELLANELLWISATCTKSHEMFMQLERERGTEMNPHRSKHLHPFDSGTYPIFYYRHGPGKGLVGHTPTKPEFFVIGRS